MADESPLSGSEEGMALDIGRTGTSTKAAVLILDQEFTDERFAEAMD